MGKTDKFIWGAVLGAAAAALLTPVTGRVARIGIKKIANHHGLDKLAAGGGDLVKSAFKSFTAKLDQKTKRKK